MTESGKEHPPAAKPVSVYIDRVQYNLASHKVTGAVLRNTARPPVPEDRDLWQEMDGPTDDELIRSDAHYEVKDWTHYYTAPKAINPGGSQ